MVSSVARQEINFDNCHGNTLILIIVTLADLFQTASWVAKGRLLIVDEVTVWDALCADVFAIREVHRQVFKWRSNNPVSEGRWHADPVTEFLRRDRIETALA